MRPRIWILVSDASRAKLFQQEGPRMDEVGDYTHTEGTLPIRDLVSDQPDCRRMGHEDRLGMSPAKDPKEPEAGKFARQLAGVLKQGLDAHRYDSLELMAPPHFLGLLRSSLDQQVAKRVTASFEQNFIDEGATTDRSA